MLVSVTALAGSLTAASPALAISYYVNGATGTNANSCLQAQNPSTPKKTIGKGNPQLDGGLDGGVQCAVFGDTVRVGPGTYAESVESKRDGQEGKPIVLQSTIPGGAVIQPPLIDHDNDPNTPMKPTNGFFLTHNYITIDGFTIRQGLTALKLGPHEGSNGPVIGLLIQNNVIHDNTTHGVQVNNGLQTEIAFNTIYQNARNGIVYSGNGSLIHDNVVHHNGHFGIYIKDGVDHQLYDNSASANTASNLQILGTLLPTPQLTYYVDCINGNDAFTPTQAKNPGSPWKTVKAALAVADAGDTISVLGRTEAQPVVCNEATIESKRDGTAADRITIQAVPPLSVIFDPPAGNGIVITHSYHLLNGLIVTGAVNGIQLGPHDDGDGPVNGLVVNGSRIYGNSVTGVKFANAIDSVIKHSIVNNNGSHGISYSGSGANIFNNLIYRNGGDGDYGVTILSGSGHKIRSNTLSGNVSGGLRLSTSGATPVSFIAGSIKIIANSPSASRSRPGTSTINYNDGWGTRRHYLLTLSQFGPIPSPRISVHRRAGDDYRIGRIATGQAANSAVIDAGSTRATPSILGADGIQRQGGRFGRRRSGYHGTSSTLRREPDAQRRQHHAQSGVANDRFSSR
jgi:parallel beta-helix repeat protein